MDTWSVAAVGLAQDLMSPALRVLGLGHRRRAGGGATRTHLEVRGAHRIDDGGLRRSAVKHVLTVPGVHGAVVNAVLGRIVVDHDPEVTPGALVAAVEQAEETAGLADAEVAAASGRHPADTVALTRELAALGLDAAGAATLVVERVLTPLAPPTALLPPALTAGLSLVDAVPSLRGLAEQVMGASSTESWFSLGSATVQAIGRGPLGLLADGVYRGMKATDAAARARAWREWDAASALDEHDAGPVDIGERPAPFPAGPVERVGDASGLAALLGAGLAAALLSPRAVAVASAGVPKPARWGREAFAAATGHALAGRGALVLDPAAMRRADRVDVVVVDGTLLRRPVVATLAARVGRVVPHAPGTARDEVDAWQRQGHGVALITADPAAGEALGAADVGIALYARGCGEAAWSADVVCLDTDGVAIALGALGAARTAAWQAAALALLSTGAALPAALLLALPGHRAWANVPVTAGALAALLLGTWTGTAAARAALDAHGLERIAAMTTQTQYRLTNPPPRVDATEGYLDVPAGDVPQALEIEGLGWEFDGWDSDVALYRRA